MDTHVQMQRAVCVFQVEVAEPANVAQGEYGADLLRKHCQIPRNGADAARKADNWKCFSSFQAVQQHARPQALPPLAQNSDGADNVGGD